MQTGFKAVSVGVLMMLSAGTALSQSAGSSLPWSDRFDTASPATVGLSDQALQSATSALRARVEANDIAGAVAAIMKDDKLVYAEAVGWRDIESRDEMPLDALFRTYSMTRPVTAVAILLLHDQGLLDVNDPVSQYLPAFANQPVLIDSANPDPGAVRARVGDITLAQLLTHTSGLGSRSSSLYRANNVHSYDQTLAQVVDNAAALPLFEDPGTQFRYGLHAEVLGRVIEVVTGQPVDVYLEEQLFQPLGMTDTVFYVDEERAPRLATVYRPDDAGQVRAIEMEDIPVTERRTLTSSGVGLVSSTADFLSFSHALLTNTRPDGEALFSEQTRRLVSENAIPDALLPIGSGGYWLGSGWSLGGFAVAMDPAAYNHPVSTGEYWWDGSAGTRFWIDPVNNMIAVIMAQVSPASGNGFREEFKTNIVDALNGPAGE